ncbi:hypothetical protein C823_004342 [Eubacterium plexicaudatum ASF492]|nr:hypothetical protein C823_004342 [Eubacterium plexicaudatum ASF492]
MAAGNRAGIRQRCYSIFSFSPNDCRRFFILYVKLKISYIISDIEKESKWFLEYYPNNIRNIAFDLNNMDKYNLFFVRKYVFIVKWISTLSTKKIGKY